MVNTDDSIVDCIYECAFVPDLWPVALNKIGKLAGARGGLLFAVNADVGVLRWLPSEGLRRELETYIAGGWLERDRRRDRVIQARHAGFLADHLVYTKEEISEDPVYRDFLRPLGLGWAAATAISPCTGDSLFFSVERDYANGPIEAKTIQRLDELRPHLARSAMISARLDLERARIAGETLQLLGLPAFLLNERGGVVFANHLATTLGDYLQWRAHDRIAFKDVHVSSFFEHLVSSIDRKQVKPPVQSFAVQNEDGRVMVAHLIPIRGAARDIFARCASVLVMTSTRPRQVPSAELIQSLFDLTPAETRVARGLASGQSADEIAQAAGVSINTVRTQVRGVLEKTGSRRLADVIVLLARLVLPID